MFELTAERTVFGKLYDMGGRKRRVVAEKRPQHYPDDEGKLQDIDTVPRVRGKSLVVDKAWGKSTVSDASVHLDYESRVLGSFTMRLVALDDIPVESLALNIAPKIEGSSIFWRDLMPDLDIELRFWPGRVEWFKYLNSAAAPRSLTWDVLLPERKDRSFTLQEVSRGWDSRKTQADLSDGRRWAKMQHTSTPISGGVRVREEFLNAVMDVEDPTTRVRVEKTDVLYPVIIDVEVDEDIVATADDQYDVWATGSSFSALNDGDLYDMVYVGTYGANITRSVGFRFQGVAIPAGATIDDATLNVWVQSKNTGDDNLDCEIVGAEEDDAPAWSTSVGHRPHDMQNPTTARSATFTFADVPAAGNNWAIDVTAAVVQEMIDDPASWVSGNDMRLALDQGTCSYYPNVVGISDYSHATNPAPNFVVNYTEGGNGANPKGPLGHPLHGPFAGPIN